MYSSCQISTPGKWILTGEHAVLRGKSAIVFPLSSKRFILDYHAEDIPVDIRLQGTGSDSLERSFWQGIDRALERLQLNRTDLSGIFFANNQIPVGSGMGASAALSVALSNWFVQQRKLDAHQVTSFATDIEHLYHGRSSGLDIAGVQSNHGIIFTQGTIDTLDMHWQPHWALSFSGEASNTAQCIAKVRQFQENHPACAAEIDAQMQYSCDTARQALGATPQSGLRKLAEAIQLGLHCFQQWGLINANLENHLHILRQHGALAAKPTGSGGGGYVISLWNEPPPGDLQFLGLETLAARIEDQPQ